MPHSRKQKNRTKNRKDAQAAQNNLLVSKTRPSGGYILGNLYLEAVIRSLSNPLKSF